MTNTEHIVIMGVSGSGKSTIGRALADRLGRPFADGDDFHSATNRAAMAAGVPLTDADRWPWLASIRDWMSARGQRGTASVVACSALKRSYRQVLAAAQGGAIFIELAVPRSALAERMHRRTGHFMPESLLDSQLDALQHLEPREAGFAVSAGGPVGETIEAILRRLDELRRADN